jgi:hypothetical protein
VIARNPLRFAGPSDAAGRQIRSFPKFSLNVYLFDRGFLEILVSGRPSPDTPNLHATTPQTMISNTDLRPVRALNPHWPLCGSLRFLSTASLGTHHERIFVI